jgi:hypothetical protein
LDEKGQTHAEFLTGVKNADLKLFTREEISHIKGNAGQQVLFGVFAFVGDNLEDMVGMVTQKGTDLGAFWESPEVQSVISQSDTRKYLTIVNESSAEVSLQITSSQPFALPDTLLEVSAHYGDTEVGLEAIFKEPFPNFLQGVSWDTTSSL